MQYIHSQDIIHKDIKYLVVRQPEPRTQAEWHALHVTPGGFVPVQGTTMIHTADNGFSLGVLLANRGDSSQKMYALLKLTWTAMPLAGKSRCYLATYQRYNASLQLIVQQVR